MGERERKSLLAGRGARAAAFEEAPAFIGGEVLAAAGVDELEISDQARHFA